MLFFLINLSFADPQDIPKEAGESEDTDETTEEVDSDEAADAETTLEIIDSLKKETILVNEIEELPQGLTEEDINLDFLSGMDITQPEYNEDYDDDNDNDFSWFRGGIDYSLDLHLWESEGASKSVWSLTAAGDPQYLWEIRDNLGPTLGLRFKLSGTDTQQTLIKDNLIGIITGFQLKKLRINTSAAYMSHHLFHQIEQQRDHTSKEISYLYQELLPLKGILLEQTLTLALDNTVIQAFYGTPFALSEQREMGAVFKDSWKAGGNIVFSSSSIGYEYSVYPENQEHIISFGTSLGR